MKRVAKNSRALSLFAVCLLAVFGNAMATGRHNIDDNKTNLAAVLLGPCGLPGAIGPTGIDDDFSNRSIDTGIANVPPGGLTTAAGAIVFRNTVENVGRGDDAFIISVPVVPAGFRVEISTDYGDHYVTVDSSDRSVTVPVAYHASGTFFVQVTAPAGIKVLTGFDTVIRATSTINAAVTNDTIDRLYTGFIRIDKTVNVVNATGSGSIADATPGAEIEFAITYSNISSDDGVGSSLLTAHNIIINENGYAAPNNWGATTEHVVGASDNRGGLINGDRAGSTSLTDMIMTLEPGQSGVFKFRRRIK